MTSQPLRIAVLISGGGTNLQAILDAIDAGLPAEVVAVISNRPDAFGLTRAARNGVPGHVLDHTACPSREAFDAALAALLDELGPDLVVLAGFMRILGEDMVTRWHGRMLNIHPSLLPAWRGLHTHRRVLEAGERWHGTSVHYVTAELDGGPVIAQSRLEIASDETETSLQQRIQALEHSLYPRVIDWIARGRLTLTDGIPVLDGVKLEHPVLETCNETRERA